MENHGFEINRDGSNFMVSFPEEKAAMWERFIGDGMYYIVVDVIVRPEYQHIGIGSKIMDMLIGYVDVNTPVGGRSSVQLIAEKGKEDFYIKIGFKLIPHEYCGSGMRRIIDKRHLLLE